ncbi:MAG: preprotein translocase subunit SecA [Chloroflexi bacterium]|nr:preprotein translocase subunit SecA [Chloroflexota bacterium]
MVKGILGVFGNSNDKVVKKLWRVVDEINALELGMIALSDGDLKGITEGLRRRWDAGETLDDLLPEAFAAVREAAKRRLGMRHFDTQLIGGMVLHQGKIAEMATGEGKTLVATLPTYLNSLTGQAVHVVTVNDYLAKRDAQWMGPVFDALGVAVGCLQHESSLLLDLAIPGPDQMRPVHRREAYAAGAVYGTNSEFGFDYLRDNMALDLSQRVQGDRAYAIVDEVDYILIDEARTPLIISGPAQRPTQSYDRFALLARRLVREEDFLIEERTRAVSLTEIGTAKIEQALEVDNLYLPEHYSLVHFIENALKAEAIFERDKEYVVTNDNQVVIVDEFTGRLMPGRRYSDGLHQAIEAKESVEVQRESVTLATITLQNYFRMYTKLSGMTGTAATEGEELFKIYRLDVVVIPTNRPTIRVDQSDLVYLTEAAKFNALADEVQDLHEQQRPVLIGTTSIETSERLSHVLSSRGIPHEILNAKQHEREATIVAQAGKLGAVVLATNMAGRGTDIILGGNPAGREPAEWRAEHEAVVQLGGLYVLGTERHEARRIDNQLRGRAGRQGDPGMSQIFVSLEDEVIRRFGGERVKAIMTWAGMEDDTPIQNRVVTKSFENAQTRVEAYNFEIRKHLVEYDDVINRQREVIYEERSKVLEGADLKANILEMVRAEIADLADAHLTGRDPLEWDVETLLSSMAVLMPLPEWANGSELQDFSKSDIEESLVEHAEAVYDEKEELVSPDRMRQAERLILLQLIDNLWVNHLTAMENMRQGVGLQAYGQRDPLTAYRQEGHGMFQELLSRLRHDLIRALLHLAIRVQPQPEPEQQSALAHDHAQHAQQGELGAFEREGALRGSPMASQQRDAQGLAPGALAGGGIARAPVRAAVKIGRNDPCHCGSGLKYKKCHGTAA